MSFSLCAVIAEAFKRERQQLKPAAGASECTGQFTGQPRRSGCTPAEPYPPGGHYQYATGALSCQQSKPPFWGIQNQQKV